jgi:1,4-dihydroxy-2-naphthoate octaprenyltransferase
LVAQCASIEADAIERFACLEWHVVAVEADRGKLLPQSFVKRMPILAKSGDRRTSATARREAQRRSLVTHVAEQTPPGLVEPFASRLAALKPLRKVAKFTVVQHYFGIPLAATLLPAAVLLSWRTFAVLALCLLCLAGVVAATTALDDLTGYRDGSDALNYGAAGRGSRTKPLLQGGVTERSVLVFALTCEVIALLAGFGAIAVAQRWTPLALGLFLVPALLCPHYSWGLRISYRPVGGELLVFCATVATLLWPYALLSDTGIGAMPVAEAVLLGLWFLLVVISENTNDVGGDRAVGRRTVPVIVSLAAVRWILFGLIAGWVGITVAYTVRGVFAPIVFGFLAPTLALHMRHLVEESRRQLWLRGAAISFMAFNLGFAGLLAMNLLR